MCLPVCLSVCLSVCACLIVCVRARVCVWQCCVRLTVCSLPSRKVLYGFWDNSMPRFCSHLGVDARRICCRIGCVLMWFAYLSVFFVFLVLTFLAASPYLLLFSSPCENQKRTCSHFVCSSNCCCGMQSVLLASTLKVLAQQARPRASVPSYLCCAVWSKLFCISSSYSCANRLVGLLVDGSSHSQIICFSMPQRAYFRLSFDFSFVQLLLRLVVCHGRGLLCHVGGYLFGIPER